MRSVSVLLLAVQMLSLCHVKHVCAVAGCAYVVLMSCVVCLSCLWLAVQMLGRCMFTVTCTESMTLPMMLQYMTGMVQSGCWMLFDDTDHLTKGTPQTFTHICTPTSSKAPIRGHKLGCLNSVQTDVNQIDMDYQ